MDVYELVDACKGSVVRDRAIVKFDGKYVIVGRVTAEGMIMTTEGKEIVDTINEAPKVVSAEAEVETTKPATPKKKAAKKKAASK